ncbi:MAG TPA: hypothetical protein VFG11_01080 [Acidobacteriota bacterium]|nr:hypothetical protein [Acidobacteriota bacterium]
MDKNITLKLDETVLRRARLTAVEKDQSVSEWVAGLVMDATSRRDRFRDAKHRALRRLQKGYPIGEKG